MVKEQTLLRKIFLLHPKVHIFTFLTPGLYLYLHYYPQTFILRKNKLSPVSQAILQERPEIEHRRREALEREEQLSGEIESARHDLLVQLGAARGQDILQESQDGGGGLLSTLELTQSKAQEIARALEQSRRDLEDIGKRSREHERLAKFTAILYKFVRSFAALSSLYVFTSEALTEIFLEAERTRAGLESASRDEREKVLEKT